MVLKLNHFVFLSVCLSMDLFESLISLDVLVEAGLLDDKDILRKFPKSDFARTNKWPRLSQSKTHVFFVAKK